MHLMPYYLGCPVWSSEKWAGMIYPEGTARGEWLHWYSRAFNTVEGNTTFYAIPPEKNAKKWASSVVPGFKFSLKHPKWITHDKLLENAREETLNFLKVLEIFRNRDVLGPTFLQLPPRFSGKQFHILEKYLRELPREFPWAVEVRHANYFERGSHNDMLNSLLTELQMDRVILDTRPLFSTPPEDDMEKGARRKKPQVPVEPVATGKAPLVRLISSNKLEKMKPFIDEWVPIIAGWIREGRTPYVFTHSPDDANAPLFGKMFHDALRKEIPNLVDPFPTWPAQAPADPRQKTLF